VNLPNYILTAICLMFLSIFTAANEPSAAAILTQQLQNMNSLSAQFSQQSKDDKGKVLQTASGTVSVKRPNRLRWQILKPDEQLLVTDGDVLWLYDIDLEQVTRQAFSADLANMPGLLLSGEVEQIASQYQVKIVSDGGKNSSNESNKTFELVPLKDSGLFSRLTLSFNGQKITSMVMRDSLGQLTLIEFSDVKLNPPIDDALFKFSAPDGIDVIIND
jgi:outer membrane lipoprotein carrier protein